MSPSRRWLLAAPAVLLAGLRSASADPGDTPPAVIERFYGVLLAVMKQARQLSFEQRYQRLQPVISEGFDLGLMTRLAIGPGWAQLAAEQQQRLTAAFARYTISVYANRFDDYGGERFEVSPTTTASPS